MKAMNNKLNKIFLFVKSLFNFTTKDNLYCFEYRLSKDIQKGMVFGYNEIEFYVKDFSSHKDKLEKKLKDFEYNTYIVCEYYDIEKKEFVEKILHEDFVKYRIAVWKGIILNKE